MREIGRVQEKGLLQLSRGRGKVREKTHTEIVIKEVMFLRAARKRKHMF